MCLVHNCCQVVIRRVLVWLCQVPSSKVNADLFKRCSSLSYWSNVTPIKFEDDHIYPSLINPYFWTHGAQNIFMLSVFFFFENRILQPQVSRALHTCSRIPRCAPWTSRRLLPLTHGSLYVISTRHQSIETPLEMKIQTLLCSSFATLLVSIDSVSARQWRDSGTGTIALEEAWTVPQLVDFIT